MVEVILILVRWPFGLCPNSKAYTFSRKKQVVSPPCWSVTHDTKLLS